MRPPDSERHARGRDRDFDRAAYLAKSVLYHEFMNRCLRLLSDKRCIGTLRQWLLTNINEGRVTVCRDLDELQCAVSRTLRSRDEEIDYHAEDYGTHLVLEVIVARRG